MPRIKNLNDLRIQRPAPVEFAGQWVAWDKSRSQILHHAATLAEVRRASAQAGHDNVIFQFVRPPQERYVGTT